MSKALINKHVDNVKDLSRSLFVEDLEKAKGEIIISNDETNPSIYILNSKGNITKISGGGSSGEGGGSYDDTLIWQQVNTNTDDIKTLSGNTVNLEEYNDTKEATTQALTDIDERISGLTTDYQQADIALGEVIEEEVIARENAITAVTEAYQAADTVLNEGITALTETVSSQGESISNLTTAVDSINENISDITGALNAVDTALNTLNGDVETEGSVKYAVNELKTVVDEYNINGKKVSDNPVLNTTDINVPEDYSTLNYPEENIHPGDVLTDALGKIEIMMANTTLCMTAAINDLDARLGTPTEYNDKNQVSKKATGVYKMMEDVIENMAILHPEVYNPILENGGDVVLYRAYRPSEPVVLANDVDLKVNLNNQMVVAPTFAESNGEVLDGNSDSYAFWVKEGGKLTIEGDGEVVARDADYSMAVWAQGGTVEIKGGKFYNGGDGCDLIYASKGGKVYIYDGEFHATENTGAEPATGNKYSALNIKNSDRANSDIIVYGGKFYGFDPANNDSEPNPSEEWLASHPNGFVAEGCESVEIEPGVWQVRVIE